MKPATEEEEHKQMQPVDIDMDATESDVSTIVDEGMVQ